MNTKTQDKKLIITMLSDSPFIPTGFSNQSKLLAKYLREQGHEVHYLANAYNGAVISHAKLQDGTTFDYKIYGEMIHSYFQNQISEHLKKTKSDIFYILLDTFMVFPWFLNIDTSPAKVIFWYPSDGGAGMPKGCENILKKVDVPVAMSEFGQKQVFDYYGIKTEHIPHGIEPKRFYKMPDQQRIELRNRLGLNDKFVIGVVARNQPRKMLDKTLKTMFLLKDKIPNAVLLLHLDPNDPARCMDLNDLISRFNLENRVIFTGMKANEGFDWDKMNEVYNVMDCFFLSTSGEGFGIPIIESMACQVPVVATSYTTTPELVEKNNAGFGIKLAGCEEVPYAEFFNMKSKDYDDKVVNGTTTGGWMVERGIIDCQDAADKIVRLFKDDQLRKVMGVNGRKAVESKYDFEKHVGPAFEKIFYGDNNG